MSRRLVLELIGDPQSLIRSFKRSAEAADTLGRDLKALGLTAEQSAKKQVDASVRRDARLRQEVLAYRQIASAAAKGSREQVTAANLATSAERRLASSLGVTSKEAAIHARNINISERQLGKATRGALAGAGVFHSLGRSLAFASGGFLAIATASNLIRQSIDAATEAAKSERQLAVQFTAVGASLGPYKKRIEEVIFATSKLAGIEDDELRKSFTAAFRGSKDVDAGLKIMKASTDAAAGSHKNLQVVTLALTKAYLGQTGAARRLGVLIPPQLKGLNAIAFVQKRFAGQAAEGATSQDRFNAALHRTKETVGFQLLPALTQTLDKTTEWLDKQENQEKIQRDVNKVVKDGALVVGGFAAAIKLVSPPIEALNNLLGGTHDAVELLLAAFGAKKLAGLLGAEAGVGTAAATSAGKVDMLTASLTKLTAGPWILTAIVAVKDIQDPSSITRRAKGLLSTIRNAGPSVAGGLETLPTVGPVVAGIRAAFGKDSKQASDKIAKATAGGFQKLINDAILTTAAFVAKSGLTGPGKAGFKARFADQELALAQAQLTTQSADDRKVLVIEAGLIQERIKTISGHRKHLQEQIQLTQQLKGVQDQITQIDQQGIQNTIQFKQLELRLAQAQLTMTQTDDDRAILEAEAAAVKRQLARLPKTKATLDARIQLTQQLAGIEGQIQQIDQTALDKRKAAVAKHLAAVKQKEQALKQQIKSITDQFASALDTARQALGELFQGPLLAPTDAQIKAKLGVPGPTTKQLTADLNAQINQLAQFQKALATLAKRGAPKELLRELRAKGPEALPLVQQLATASKADLQKLFRVFGKGEKLVQSIAKAEMRAQLVVLRADKLQLQQLRSQPARKMATGGAGTVYGPTLFMAGEGGAEDYAFVPHGKGRLGGGGGTQTFHQHIHVEIDGREVGGSTTKFQVRRQKLIVPQRRGGTAGKNPMGP